MLTKVEIENFQSHRNTVVNFVPGTNVIVGPSDAGKSAILRAICWVVTNRPLGDGYRSEWGGDTKVTLYTSDGHVVQRIRSTSENAYIVDGETLRAFGTDVPQIVSDVLRIDEYSIQRQMDPPFLLSETPGEAARILNKAAGLDEIDRVLSNLQKSYNRNGKDLQYLEEQLKQCQEQLVKYDALPKIDEALSLVEQQEREYVYRENRLVLVKNLLEKAEQLVVFLYQLEEVDELYEQHKGLLELYDDFYIRVRSLVEVRICLDKIRELQRKIQQAEIPAKTADLMRYAEEQLTVLTSRSSKAREAHQLLGKAMAVKEEIYVTEKSLSELEKEYEESFPNICPLCGQALTTEHNHD